MNNTGPLISDAPKSYIRQKVMFAKKQGPLMLQIAYAYNEYKFSLTLKGQLVLGKH